MFMYELLRQTLIFAFGYIGIKASKPAAENRGGLKKSVRVGEKKEGLILPSSTVSLALVLISPALLVAVHS